MRKSTQKEVLTVHDTVLKKLVAHKRAGHRARSKLQLTDFMKSEDVLLEYIDWHICNGHLVERDLFYAHDADAFLKDERTESSNSTKTFLHWKCIG